MGFKFKRVDLLCGSDEFPSGSGYDLQYIRSKSILTHLVNALISMDIGWELDQNRNLSVNDVSEVPCQSGTHTFPGLFLKNSESGCKLFMAYFGGSYGTDDCIKKFSDNAFFIDVNTASITGCICSMIPEGSTQEFGNFFDSDFLPHDATRLVGTSNSYYQSSGYHGAHAYYPSDGYYYGWGIYANNRTISINASCSIHWGYNIKPHLPAPVYAVGKLFSDLYHEEDNSVISKYGIIIFHFPGGYDNMNEGWGYDISYSSYLLNGDSVLVIGASPTESVSSSSFGGCISNANGEWILGTNRSTYSVKYTVLNPYSLSSYIHNMSDGSTNWSPIVMFVQSSNLNEYNIVPGDGLKGILDTNLFRAGRGEMGTVLDNGNFIVAEEPQYRALLFGWDPSNTDGINKIIL